MDTLIPISRGLLPSADGVIRMRRADPEISPAAASNLLERPKRISCLEAPLKIHPAFLQNLWLGKERATSQINVRSAALRVLIVLSPYVGTQRIWVSNQAKVAAKTSA